VEETKISGKLMQRQNFVTLPPILLDDLFKQWLLEDLGRGDRTTLALQTTNKQGKAQWIAKETGIIAGLPYAARIFQLLTPQIEFTPLIAEGDRCSLSQVIAET
jgi:nicotinate-nucleotide pyrophosphorylase (carboxylating)